MKIKYINKYKKEGHEFIGNLGMIRYRVGKDEGDDFGGKKWVATMIMNIAHENVKVLINNPDLVFRILS